MLNVAEFQQIVVIERKLESGEQLSEEDQVFAAKYKVQGPKLCGYKGCTNKLGPRVDGEHRKIGDVMVCEDCYFDQLGDELEKYPIGLGIRRRGGGVGHID